MKYLNLIPGAIRGIGNLFENSDRISDPSSFIKEFSTVTKEKDSTYAGFTFHTFKLSSTGENTKMTVNVSPTSLEAGDNCVITVRLTAPADANDNTFSQPCENVTIYMYEGNIFRDEISTDSNGLATFNYSSSIKGLHTLSFSSKYENGYNPCSINCNLYIYRDANLSVSISDLDISHDENTTITATLLDEYNKPIIGETVKIYENEREIFPLTNIGHNGYITNSQGQVSLTYTENRAWYGSNDVLITLTAPDSYELNTSNTFTVTLKSNGVLIDGSLDIYVDNTVEPYTTITTTDGIATFTYIPGDYNYHNFYAVFNGIQDEYLPNISNSFKLKAKHSPLVILKSSKDVELNVNESCNLTASVSDPNNSFPNYDWQNKSITFKETVNNITTELDTVTTDINGNAVLTDYTKSVKCTSNIKAEFTGDDQFYNSDSNNNIVLFGVKYINMSLSCNDILYLNTSNIITATLLTRKGTPIVNEPVEFIISGISIGTVNTDNTGVASISYTPNTIGEYIISINHDGNSNYMQTSIDKEISIVKQQSLLNVISYIHNNGDIGLKCTLSVTGGYLIGKTINLSDVDGNIIDTGVTDNNGLYDFRYTPSEIDNNFNISYNGDSIYSSVNTSITKQITPQNPVLNIPTITNKPCGDTIIKTYLTLNNDGIPNKTINFYLGTDLDNIIATGITDTKNGKIITTISDLDIDFNETKTITAVFTGDEAYTGVNTTYDLIGSKSNIKLGYNIGTSSSGNIDNTGCINYNHGNASALTITATDCKQNPAINVPITLYLINSNNISETIGTLYTDNNGVCTFDIDTSTAGLYTTKIYATESDKYLSNTIRPQLKVNKHQTHFVIESDTSNYGSNPSKVDMTIYLLKKDNTPVKNQNIDFSFSGVNTFETYNNSTTNSTTDLNGMYKFTMDIVENLSFTVNYTGTEHYLESSKNWNINLLNKTLPLITIDEATNNIINKDMSPVDGYTIPLHLNFKTSNNDPLIYTQFDYTIDNNTITAKTDNAGKCLIYYTPKIYGSYNLSIHLPINNGFCLESTNDFTLNLNRIESKLTNLTQLTAHYGDTVPVSIKLTDNDNNPICNESIQFLSTDNTFSKTDLTEIDEDSNLGVASVDYNNFPISNVELTASFSGNNIYLPSSIQFSITNNRLTPVLYVSNTSVKTGESCTITALLSCNSVKLSNKTINFDLISNTNIITSLTGVTDTNGNISLSFKTDNNTQITSYNIKASYDGSNDPNYTSTNGSGTITVNGIQTILTTNDITTTVGTSTNLTATLLDASNNPIIGQTINFYSGNNLMTNGSVTTNSNGIATFTYTPAVVRTTSVTAKFEPNSSNNYLGSNSTFTLTINKINTILTSNTIATAEIGNTAIIKTTLTKDDGVTPISNQTINYSWIEGTTTYNQTAVTNTSGVATLNFITDMIGTFNINATLNSTSIYNNSSTILQLNCTTHPSSLDLSGNTTTMSIGTTINLTGTLTYKNNGGTVIPINNATLTFSSGGQIIGTAVTNSSGIGTLSYTAKTAETSNITVSYTGNSTNNIAGCNNSFILTKTGAKNSPLLSITVSNNNGSYDIYDNTVCINDLFKLNLKLSYTGTGISGKTVEVYENSVLINSGVTDSNGYVRDTNSNLLTYTPTITGSHVLTFKFDGNNDLVYNSANNILQFTVNKIGTNITTNSAGMVTKGNSIYVYPELDALDVLVNPVNDSSKWTNLEVVSGATDPYYNSTGYIIPASNILYSGIQTISTYMEIDAVININSTSNVNDFSIGLIDTTLYNYTSITQSKVLTFKRISNTQGSYSSQGTVLTNGTVNTSIINGSDINISIKLNNLEDKGTFTINGNIYTFNYADLHLSNTTSKDTSGLNFYVETGTTGNVTIKSCKFITKSNKLQNKALEIYDKDLTTGKYSLINTDTTDITGSITYQKSTNNVTIAPTTKGEIDLRTVFDGDTVYDASINDYIIPVYIPTTITFNSVSCGINTNATIIASIKDYFGNPLVNVLLSLEIDINGSDTMVDLLTDNTGTITYTGYIPDSLGSKSLGVGFNTALNSSGTVNTSYNSNYQENDGSATLTVKTNTILTHQTSSSVISGNTVVLTATLKNSDSNTSISGQTVYFYVQNGTSWTLIGSSTTNSSGVVTLNYTPNTPATAIIKAVYNETTSYMGTNDSYTLYVQRPTVLTASNSTYNGSGYATLTATLKDNLGNVLSGYTVSFSINSVIYTAVTDINGVATNNNGYTPSDVGGKTVTVSFTGTGIYATATNITYSLNVNNITLTDNCINTTNWAIIGTGSIAVNNGITGSGENGNSSMIVYNGIQTSKDCTITCTLNGAINEYYIGLSTSNTVVNNKVFQLQIGTNYLLGYYNGTFYTFITNSNQTTFKSGTDTTVIFTIHNNVLTKINISGTDYTYNYYIPTGSYFYMNSLSGYNSNCKNITLTKSIPSLSQYICNANCNALDEWNIYSYSGTTAVYANSTGIHGTAIKKVYWSKFITNNNCTITGTIKVLNVNTNFRFGLCDATQDLSSSTYEYVNLNQSTTNLQYRTGSTSKSSVAMLSLATDYPFTITITNGDIVVSINSTSYDYGTIQSGLSFFILMANNSSTSNEIVCENLKIQYN